MAEHLEYGAPGSYGGPAAGGYGGGGAGGEYGGGGFGGGVGGGYGGGDDPAGGFAAAGPGDRGPLAPDSGGGAAVRLRTGPWSWVIAATVSAVAGLLLAIGAALSGTPTDATWPALALPGWALAGIVTFVLLGAHLVADTRRQAEGPYISTWAQTVLYRVAAVVGILAVVATAIEIALWASKTGVL